MLAWLEALQASVGKGRSYVKYIIITIIAKSVWNEPEKPRIKGGMRRTEKDTKTTSEKPLSAPTEINVLVAPSTEFQCWNSITLVDGGRST